MKRIITSLGMIGVVVAVGIGATVAYFNDTETSTGNIFVAGELDLKVDHKFSSYNGNECTTVCIPNLSQNLTFDESFESPVVGTSQKWNIYDSPVSGWNVEWRNDIPDSYGSLTRPDPAHLELHRNVLGPAQDGQQYAELDSDWDGPAGSVSGEPASVTIYQDIVTVPGKKYLLKFAFSPRQSTVASNNKLEVKWNGGVVVILGPIAGGSGMNWQEYSYDVIASGNTTRLAFTDLGTADSLGTFVDNVRLYPYECEYQTVGGTCILWDEKDIGPNDYFWHFDDVKPGDYGINIISMHVFSNDAYGCLLINNPQDNENVLIGPEANAGDTTQGPTGGGELSQFLNAFVWMDNNPQNNAFDTGETQLYGPNAPLKDIKTMARLPLTSTTTAYIGVAWCLGTQTVDGTGIHCSGTGNQDVAQTDSFLASLTAYAEQQRNNSEFSCANVQLP